jgi:cytochrome oxidase assembly protein ShyY1
MMTVARGFIPARLRSSRKTGTRDLPGETGSQVLGLLRSPTGINPLATGDRIATEDPIAIEDLIATASIKGSTRF